ncbi:hypothetical protein [Nonomuraea sp. NPDC046570]|uniref:hypothetical protein n=1 Tax=Nonomuraea sp. NPDC046570 TaxID=3155255 RepID=UPI00340D98E3
MSEPEDATARYAAALRALHAAAGSPPQKAIHTQAQARQPQLRVPSSSWSDWINGRNVPANDKVAVWLISFLRGQALLGIPARRRLDQEAAAEIRDFNRRVQQAPNGTTEADRGDVRHDPDQREPR